MSFASRTLNSFFILPALLLTAASISVNCLWEGCMTTDQYGNRISLFELQRKSEKMLCETQTSLQRIRSKDRIAEALTAGKMTLVEAAAQFRSLYKDSNARLSSQQPPSVREEREAWCRKIIAWSVAKASAEQSPDRADALRQRLERELHAQRTYDSSMSLPN